MKIKELEDKLKYRELYDRQNEEYKKELERKKLEKDRIREEVYNKLKIEPIFKIHEKPISLKTINNNHLNS